MGGGVDAQFHHRAPHGFLAGVAQGLLPRRIHVEVGAVLAAREPQRVGQQLEDARQPFFGRTQPLRRAARLVDVLQDAAHAHHAVALDDGLPAHAHPDQAPIGAHDLDFLAPHSALAQAVAQGCVHGFPPDGCDELLHVVARQRRARVQPVDVEAHVGPIGDALARLFLPHAQPRHPARLAQQAVGGEQFIAHTALLRHVVEHEDQAVLALNARHPSRHEARHFGAVAQRRHWQAADLALVAQRLGEAGALLRVAPHAQFHGRTPQNLVARLAQQPLERRVHVQVAPVGQAGDARGVGQRLVDGGVFGFGHAQRVAHLVVLGDVQVNAGHAQHASGGVALHRVPARDHPAPVALVIAHARLCMEALFQSVLHALQVRAQALAVVGVAPGVPALP